MGDIGRHLRNDGDLHHTLHAGGIFLHQLRTLPHVAAHAFVLHLRTREVQLHSVATGILGHLRQALPLLLVLSHDGCYDHLRRVVLLQPAQNVEVHLHGVLAQLFHVTETVEVTVHTVVVHGVETRRHLLDFLHADGLVEHARPTGVKGPRHHLVVRTDGRRCQEERILATDAAEVNLQRRRINH